MKRSDIDRLLADPVACASMMETAEMEDVIVAFVSVLNRNRISRGGQD
jgi:hypothetical protein